MTDRELDQILDAWAPPEPPAAMRARLLQRMETKPRRFRLRPRWILAAAAGLAAVAVGQSLVTDATMGSDAGRWDDHTFWRRTRIVHPAIQWLRWRSSQGGNTGARNEGGVLSGTKFLYEPSSHARSGYEWRATPLPDGRYSLETRTLDSAAAPETRTIGAGSVFDIDLYRSGRERVYDHYELFAAPIEVLPLPDTEAAPVLTFAAPNLSINGQKAADPGGVVKVSSQILAVTVKGRGTYYFTLAARMLPGFQATGQVRGSMLEFDLAGEHLRVECTERVAAKDRPVFVLFQKDPSVEHNEFFAGGPRAAH
jgi:hypothetical protein